MNDLQLSEALRDLGFEDYRDAFEIFQQARAALREFGLGHGYIECDLDRKHGPGPFRRQGDLRER